MEKAMIDRNCVNLISFDLGSVYGWCYASYINNSKFVIRNGGTVDINSFIKNNARLYNVVDEKRKRLMIFEEQVTQLISSLNIDVIIAEDIFMNPSRPQAFQSLLLYMDTLERIVFQLKGQSIIRITPTHVKFTLTGNGHADKEEIQEAMLKKEDIEFKKTNLLCGMSSHLSDSICIGYTFSKSLSSIIF